MCIQHVLSVFYIYSLYSTCTFSILHVQTVLTSIKQAFPCRVRVAIVQNLPILLESKQYTLFL